MSNLLRSKTVVFVVNYKNLDLTMLCLRSIRKSIKYLYEVIVVNNNSCNESLEFFKLFNWIYLIERLDHGYKTFKLLSSVKWRDMLYIYPMLSRWLTHKSLNKVQQTR